MVFRALLRSVCARGVTLAFVLMPVYRGQQLRTALLSLVMAGHSSLSAELSIYVMKSSAHTMSSPHWLCQSSISSFAYILQVQHTEISTVLYKHNNALKQICLLNGNNIKTVGLIPLAAILDCLFWSAVTLRNLRRVVNHSTLFLLLRNISGLTRSPMFQQSAMLFLSL